MHKRNGTFPLDPKVGQRGSFFMKSGKCEYLLVGVEFG